MGLAAHQDHSQIDHRMAVDAVFELGADALLDARDELPRDSATDHPVDELETAALRQRLDLYLCHGVLAVPTGLLDVPAEPGAGCLDGFPDGHPYRLDGDLD